MSNTYTYGELDLAASVARRFAEDAKEVGWRADWEYWKAVEQKITDVVLICRQISTPDSSIK